MMDVGHDLGLNINVSKCELIAQPGRHVTDPILLSFQQIPSENAELLGGPLFPGTVLDLTWAKRCDELTRATERLASVGAQDALTLLRASFSSPKAVSYTHLTLPTTPYV